MSAGNNLKSHYESKGRSGSTLITGTDAHTNSDGWFCIQVISNATFTTLTDSTRDGDTLTTSDTFPAGFVLYGNFTAITLNSGKVIAYKKNTALPSE